MDLARDLRYHVLSSTSSLYRKIFRGLGWFGIQVFTVNSIQGRENKCTLFNIILTFTRFGG